MSASYEDGFREGRRQALAESAEEMDRAWREIIDFPFPKVCRHWAALKIISAMERLGCEPSDNTIRAIVECDDETALSWVREI